MLNRLKKTIKQADWQLNLWKLSHKRMPLFVHIPKTGGTYIKQGQTDRKPVIWPVKLTGHCSIVDKSKPIPRHYPPSYSRDNILDQNELNNYFVFATVRNIYDWLVSYYAHAGGFHPKFHDPSHYDYKIAHKGFEYLLNTIANRDDVWPNRKFIHFAIFSYQGDLMIDYLTRTEALDDDLKEMARSKGLKYYRRRKQRVGKRDRNYKKYYNDKLIKLVEKIWGREQKFFGYSFEGVDLEKAILKRKVSQRQKENIKYHWDEDKLMINGQEIGR